MSAFGTAGRVEVSRAAPAGEAKARLIWVGGIVGLLVAQIVMCVVAATLATGDPSFAVEPGYHDRALRWDETVAAERASEQLGWTAEVVPATAADVLGNRGVTLTLRDRFGEAIAGATVRATVFHHARAGEVREVAFVETNRPGVYAAATEMRRAGLWSFRIEAIRGDERFVASPTIDLTDAKGGAL